MKQRLNKVIAPLGEIRRLQRLLQPRNRFTFVLERLLLRGAHYRLLVIAGLIGLVATAGGLLTLAVDGGFGGPGEAVWWAFLRLTDPGYLGDDEGVARRVISTIVTVAGYVFFMGALIAILTQWLTQTMRNLERGLTPIAQRNHLLVLGWTNRTPAVVHELVLSEERVRRFLRRRGARRLRIVILAEEVGPSLVQELADSLGPDWDPNQVIFRSGTPLHIDHLVRVDFLHAAAVIVPAGDFSHLGAADQDAGIVKTLLSISRHGTLAGEETLPLVVTEIFDPSKLHVARRAYSGRVEIVLSSHFISRLEAQAIRHPGMTAVFNEILGHGDGSEIYVRSCPELVGRTFQELTGAFPGGILLGVVRPSGDSFTPILNPAGDLVVGDDDRFVVLANSYGGADPRPEKAVLATERGAHPAAPPPAATRRRLLVLGWNRKVPVLLQELEDYANERFEVDVVSNVPLQQRQTVLDLLDVRLERTQVRQLERDYTAVPHLRQAAPGTYDSILLVASEWHASDEEADARSVLATLLLRDETYEGPPPPIVVELMDAENVRLLGQDVEYLVSPVIISHILAQIALRRELRAVYDELFGPGGAEIFFRPTGDYDLVDRRVTFEEISRIAHRHGEIALGVRVSGQVSLNPAGDSQLTLAAGDRLIVVTTYDDGSEPGGEDAA